MDFQKGCYCREVGAEIRVSRTRPPPGLTICKAVMFMTKDLEKRTVVPLFPLGGQPADLRQPC